MNRFKLKPWIGIIVMMTLSTLALANRETITDTILMVSPAGFRFNAETAISNKYQHELTGMDVTKLALHEFDNMVHRLREQGINVLVYPQPDSLPDAVFPNNWFSTHLTAEGKTDLYTYPMLTSTRQGEVDPGRLTEFLKKEGVLINRVTDLRENTQAILEGTGSMILDRQNKIIYAALSPRTDAGLLDHTAHLMGYQTVAFKATDPDKHPIYHTNVMMGLAQHYAVVCLDCVTDSKERETLIKTLHETNKAIINISQDQVNHMCGNVLEVQNQQGQPYLIMSQQAFEHFTPAQKAEMARFDHLLPVQIPTIERVGGGSARCMMAEIYKT